MRRLHNDLESRELQRVVSSETKQLGERPSRRRWFAGAVAALLGLSALGLSLQAKAQTGPIARAWGLALNFTGSVWRLFADRFAERVSVKDFGALGDGVADDAKKIQATIDALYSAGGGIVHVPRGDFAIAARLNVPSNVYLRGVGRASRIVALNDIDRMAGTYQAQMIRLTGSFCGVRDLYLDGNGKDAGGVCATSKCTHFEIPDNVCGNQVRTLAYGRQAILTRGARR